MKNLYPEDYTLCIMHICVYNLIVYNQLFVCTSSFVYIAYLHYSTIALEVNHLSEDIPESLLPLKNINLLTGNLFDCTHSKKDLHQNADALYYLDHTPNLA